MQLVLSTYALVRMQVLTVIPFLSINLLVWSVFKVGYMVYGVVNFHAENVVKSGLKSSPVLRICSSCIRLFLQVDKEICALNTV